MSEFDEAGADRMADGASVRRLWSDPLEDMLKASIQTVQPGQVLIMEGDESNSVLCLLSGWLSLSKSLPDGDTQIVDFALTGDIIETGAAGAAFAAVNVEALTEVKVAVVPMPTWDAMKRQRPDLIRIATEIRAASRSRMTERMLRLGRGRAAMRVAYALLELDIRLAAIGQAKGGKFSLPMNQRILGDFVGLSGVHVCRIMGLLANDGVIRTCGHMCVEILDLDALAEMAGVDLGMLRREILAPPESMSSTLALLASA